MCLMCWLKGHKWEHLENGPSFLWFCRRCGQAVMVPKMIPRDEVVRQELEREHSN